MRLTREKKSTLPPTTEEVCEEVCAAAPPGTNLRFLDGHSEAQRNATLRSRNAHLLRPTPLLGAFFAVEPERPTPRCSLVDQGEVFVLRFKSYFAPVRFLSATHRSKT